VNKNERETLKLIQQFYSLLESVHPAKRRIIATELVKKFLPIMTGKGYQINSKYDTDIFTRAKQLGAFIIQDYGKVGFNMLKYFIKYRELC
jgi:hypothetical protein